jgi:hypothetical protein
LGGWDVEDLSFQASYGKEFVRSHLNQ